MTMPEYAASFPDEYAAFRQGRYEVVPGGESTATVTARVTAVLREALAALAPGECGVVVSHGGASRSRWSRCSAGRAAWRPPCAVSTTAAGPSSRTPAPAVRCASRRTTG